MGGRPDRRTAHSVRSGVPSNAASTDSESLREPAPSHRARGRSPKQSRRSRARNPPHPECNEGFTQLRRPLQICRRDIASSGACFTCVSRSIGLSVAPLRHRSIPADVPDASPDDGTVVLVRQPLLGLCKWPRRAYQPLHESVGRRVVARKSLHRVCQSSQKSINRTFKSVDRGSGSVSLSLVSANRTFGFARCSIDTVRQLFNSVDRFFGSVDRTSRVGQPRRRVVSRRLGR
jgi:hypothetical protein